MMSNVNEELLEIFRRQENRLAESRKYMESLTAADVEEVASAFELALRLGPESATPTMIEEALSERMREEG